MFQLNQIFSKEAFPQSVCLVSPVYHHHHHHLELISLEEAFLLLTHHQLQQQHQQEDHLHTTIALRCPYFHISQAGSD